MRSKILKALSRIPRPKHVKIKVGIGELELEEPFVKKLHSLFIELGTYTFLFTPCNIPCNRCEDHSCVNSVRRIERMAADFRKQLSKRYSDAERYLVQIQDACEMFQIHLLQRKSSDPYTRHGDMSLRTCDVADFRCAVFSSVNSLSSIYGVPLDKKLVM